MNYLPSAGTVLRSVNSLVVGPLSQMVLNLPGVSSLQQNQIIVPPFVVQIKPTIPSELVSSLPEELLYIVVGELPWDSLNACNLVCIRWAQATRSHRRFSKALVLQLGDNDEACSHVALHNLSRIRPRKITLCCKNLDSAYQGTISGGWFEGDRFNDVQTLELGGVLNPQMRWLCEDLTGTVTKLDLNLQFFESIYSLFGLIVSFEVLEELNIRCYSRVFSQFDTYADNTFNIQPSPQLHTLVFSGNTDAILPFFAAWFCSLQIPVPLRQVSATQLRTPGELNSFCALVSSISQSVGSIVLSLDFPLPLTFSAADLDFITAPPTVERLQFPNLRKLAISECCLPPGGIMQIDFNNPQRDPTGVLGLTLQSLLARFSSPSLKEIKVSVAWSEPSMDWKSLDELWVSMSKDLRSIRLHATYDLRHGNKIWEQRLPLCCARNLLVAGLDTSD
ncbi:hypothetical protein BDN72DRAFT_957005 [Pluteus cervinus]|uniref:Uncharacterized protein n=1 Tax=Pluteus cervinus TaxID=181527 RepID=A0ACD3B5C2_9AGAR|nr:hypothetical protein BDN72DRAFT_957005 [Pluteus cervinus]